ncbi:hypothetical protein HK405_002559, partial [Cladochytrium tenue]
MAATARLRAVSAAAAVDAADVYAALVAARPRCPGPPLDPVLDRSLPDSLPIAAFRSRAAAAADTAAVTLDDLVGDVATTADTTTTAAAATAESDADDAE